MFLFHNEERKAAVSDIVVLANFLPSSVHHHAFTAPFLFLPNPFFCHSVVLTMLTSTHCDITLIVSIKGIQVSCIFSYRNIAENQNIHQFLFQCRAALLLFLHENMLYKTTAACL